MIVIAGIINFNKGNVVKQEERQVLKSLLSRNNEGDIHDFGEKNCFISVASFYKNDFQCYSYQTEDSMTFLAGNPYFENCQKSIYSETDKQLYVLHDLFQKKDWDILKNNTRGVFLAIHYNKKNNHFFLLTDKLGIRPLYYFFDKKKLVFSSAFRVLENYPFLSRTLDIRGISEKAVFGYPLAKRTSYTNIKRIGAAEVIEFMAGFKEVTQYWDWSTIEEVNSQNIKEQVNNSYHQFQDAVSLRLEDETDAISFLSGGLDSRCVATALYDQGRNVHAFNFSPPASQDRLFASQFADKLNLNYTEYDFQPGADWSQMIADACKDKSKKRKAFPQKPQFVWSGDGGSVGVGFVYLDKEIAEAGINGTVNEMISAYIERSGFYFPYRILKATIRNKIKNLVFNGIKDEIGRINCSNILRSLHLFLMVNDQRRHLDQHFENLDMHNIGFHLPFFDSFFLESVFALPISYCLCHEFYMDWFNMFPEYARSVPWQTYPGHKPCPVSFSQDLHYQWAKPAFKDRKQILRQKEMAISFIKRYFKGSYPSKILSGNTLLLASILQYLNLRNCQHIFSTANYYISAWKKRID